MIAGNRWLVFGLLALLLLAVPSYAVTVTDAVASGYPAAGAGAEHQGLKITATQTGKQTVSVGVDADCTPGRAYLFNSSWSLLANQSFTSNNASMTVSLTNGSIYYIAGGNDAFTNYNHAYVSALAIPIDGTNIRFESGFYCDAGFLCSAAKVHFDVFGRCILTVTTEDTPGSPPGAPTWITPTPQDGYNTTANVTINANCSTNETSYLWFDTAADPTTLVLDNTTTGNYTTAFSTDGTYRYKAACWSATSGVGANTTVRSLVLDATPPVVTTITGNEWNEDNTTGRPSYDKNVTINLSFSDARALSSYSVNFTKGGVSYNVSDGSLSGTAQNVTRNVNASGWPAGEYAAVITIKDANGTGTLNTATKQYSFYVGNYSYVNLSSSTGQVAQFVLNFSRRSGVPISAGFSYDGVGVAVLSVNETTGTVFTANVTSGANAVHNFTWSVNVTDPGLTYGLSLVGTHTVSALSLIACGTPRVVQFTIRNEDYPSVAITSYVRTRLAINYSSVGGTTYQTYAVEDYNNQFRVCIVPANESVTANILAEHITGENLTHRYIVYGTLLSNATYYDIPLYNSNVTGDWSEFRLTVRDARTYNYLKGVVVWLERHYVEEGVWRVVQMDETTDYGQAFFDIHERTTEYRLRYYARNGTLYKITDPVKLSCTLGVCEITQLVNTGGPAASAIRPTAVLSYNNNTGMLLVNWTSPTIGSVAFLNASQGKITYCNGTQTGTSGGFSCNLSGVQGTANVALRVDGLPVLQEFLSLAGQKLSSLVGRSDGALLTVIILLVLVMAGVWSPVGAMMLMIVGLVAILWFGLASWLTMGAIVVVGVVTVVIGLSMRGGSNG